MFMSFSKAPGKDYRCFYFYMIFYDIIFLSLVQDHLAQTKKSNNLLLFFLLFSRDEATRTPDPYVPNVVRYQLRYIPKAYRCVFTRRAALKNMSLCLFVEIVRRHNAACRVGSHAESGCKGTAKKSYSQIFWGKSMKSG